MEFSFTPLPVHALQLIDEYCPFNISNCDRQREWIGFDLAGQWTNHSQTASPVVA